MVSAMHDSGVGAVERSDLVPTEPGWEITYRPRAVASRLGVSVHHVYKLIRDGQLRAVTLAGRRVVLKTDFEAFVRSLPSVKDDA